jgi:hypothetical protein
MSLTSDDAVTIGEPRIVYGQQLAISETHQVERRHSTLLILLRCICSTSAFRQMAQRTPTPIQTPGRVSASSLLLRKVEGAIVVLVESVQPGSLESNDGKAATSSSSQHAPKRQKLNHLTGDRSFPSPPPPLNLALGASVLKQFCLPLLRSPTTLQMPLSLKTIHLT